MKLLVRNLDRTTTQKELKELFLTFGVIQSCSIVLDPNTGTSKGFGFVEMPKPGEAKAAVKNLNNTALGNNIIRVKKAADKKTIPQNDPNAEPASAKNRKH